MGIQQDGVTSVPRASCLLVSVEMFVIPNWAGASLPVEAPGSVRSRTQASSLGRDPSEEILVLSALTSCLGQ